MPVDPPKLPADARATERALERHLHLPFGRGRSVGLAEHKRSFEVTGPAECFHHHTQGRTEPQRGASALGGGSGPATCDGCSKYGVACCDDDAWLWGPAQTAIYNHISI